MYVCMYVCMCVLSLCLCLCGFILSYLRMNVFLFLHLYIYIYIYIYVCTNSQKHRYTHSHIHTRLYTYVYLRIYSHLYSFRFFLTRKRLFTFFFFFFVRCDREGSDVCHFLLATLSLKLIRLFLECAMRYCVLGELFTAGSPSGIIVSVGSLGRASMTLEDPKLVKTPRTSLTRCFCAPFECVITTRFFSFSHRHNCILIHIKIEVLTSANTYV